MGIEESHKAFEELEDDDESAEEIQGASMYTNVKNALEEVDLTVMNDARNADRKEDLKRVLRYTLEQLEKQKLTP